MLYNPATETVADCLKDAADLLQDIGGTVSDLASLRPRFRLAWNLMVSEFRVHSLAEMQKEIEVQVPAGSTSFGPSWSNAAFKINLLDDMQKVLGPLYINLYGFLRELKVAQNPVDMNGGAKDLYREFGSTFYVNPPDILTTYRLYYESNLACPIDGPIGINNIQPYLVFKTAYISGHADGNISAKLDTYDKEAMLQLNKCINIELGQEAPITPGQQDYDHQIGGTRRFIIRN